MSKLMVAFAMAAGFAASETAAQNTRPNFRAEIEKNATATTTTATTTTERPETPGSKFMYRAAAAEGDSPPSYAVDQNPPYWQPINQPGMPLDYFRYWGVNAARTEQEARSPDFNNEILGSTTDKFHPGYGQEVNFSWQPSTPIAAETKFSGNVTVNQPENHIYWFDLTTKQNLGRDPVNDPHYRYVLPSEFTISQKDYGVKGFNVQGAVTGNAPGSPEGSYAIAFMYMTDRRASDGNNEYGFWQELASTNKDAQPKDQPLYFYYSTRTNCFEGWGCRSEDNFDSKADEQKTYGPVVIKNVRGYDEDKPPNFFYSAYMVRDNKPDLEHNTGYKFHIQIVDGYHTDRLATCSINGGPDLPCAADVPIENFFPAGQMQNGQNWMVTGTQTAISGTTNEGVVVDRAPRFEEGKDPPKFNVKGVWLGR